MAIDQRRMAIDHRRHKKSHIYTPQVGYFQKILNLGSVGIINPYEGLQDTVNHFSLIRWFNLGVTAITYNFINFLRWPL